MGYFTLALISLHQLCRHVKYHISEAEKDWIMENSSAWRGKAGKRDAKSAIDADHSGSCFPYGGGTNAGFGGPAEGVLKISASKIFDQWLTADAHEGSHAPHARPPFSSGPQWNWIKPGPSAIQAAGISGGSPGYIIEDTWPLSHTHTHAHACMHTQTHTHTELQLQKHR